MPKKKSGNGKKQGDGGGSGGRQAAPVGDKVAAAIGSLIGLWLLWLAVSFIWTSCVSSLDPW